MARLFFNAKVSDCTSMTAKLLRAVEIQSSQLLINS